MRLSLGSAPYNFPDSVAAGKAFKLGTSVQTTNGNGVIQTLASGTVGADLTVGGLTFDPAVMTAGVYTPDLMGEGCTGDAAATPADAKLVSVDDVVLLTPEQTLSGVTRLELMSSANDLAFLVHAEQRVTLKGSMACEGIKATFDATLNPGWNLVHQVFSGAAVTVTAEVASKVTFTPPRNMGPASLTGPDRNFLR